MANFVWCDECKAYVEPEDKRVEPMKNNEGWEDKEDPRGMNKSYIGLGKTVVRRCPKGHMLNVGTEMGMHGTITRRN